MTTATENYKAALLELRRNHIRANSSNEQENNEAVAKTVQVVEAFKAARAEVVPSEKDDDAKLSAAAKAFQNQFKTQGDNQDERWYALKDAVTKQKNGDATITGASINTLKQAYIEARLAYYEGIEDRKEVAERTEIFIRNLKESPYDVALKNLRINILDASDLVRDADAKAKSGAVKQAYIDAYKALPGKTPEQAEATANAWVETLTEDAASAKKAYDALRDAVKAQVKGDTTITNDEITKLRGAYAKSRLKALEGIETESEALRFADVTVEYAKAEAEKENNAKPVAPTAPEKKAQSATGERTVLTISGADAKVAAWQQAINAYEAKHNGKTIAVDGAWQKETQAAYEKLREKLKLDKDSDAKAVINALHKEGIRLMPENFVAPAYTPTGPKTDKAQSK
jgi:hypothetical protein